MVVERNQSMKTRTVGSSASSTASFVLQSFRSIQCVQLTKYTRTQCLCVSGTQQYVVIDVSQMLAASFLAGFLSQDT